MNNELAENIALAIGFVLFVANVCYLGFNLL
jgi:hypothetical protein